MRSALKELETHKYLVRRRTKNELGQFEYMYIIYEVPYTENQRADKRNAKKQSAGNDSQISKEKKNKEKINKDISNKEDLERFYGLKEQKSLEKFRKVFAARSYYRTSVRFYLIFQKNFRIIYM